MAKPLPVASPDSPGSSISPTCRRQDFAQPSYRPRHRKNPSPKPSSSSAPSSGLLVLLASVVSASTANGSPAPPPFLCPSLGLEDVEGCSVKKRSLSSPITVAPAPQTTNVFSPRGVPDRYHQDTDGVWRRVASYTLYGSTVSACATGTCRQPTNVVSPVDDQIQVSSSTNTTDSAATAIYDIRDTLPPGWRPSTRVQSRTPLILSVSLVLALVICFFIMSCLFWRKKVKKRHRNNDVEAKAKKKKGELKERILKESLAEKECISQQKIWARATARWKANVRFTARLRRGRRFNSRMSHAQQSSISLDLSRPRSTGSSIRSMSSRRSSISTIPDQVYADENSPMPSNDSQEQPPSSATTPQNNLPPAYQHPTQCPPMESMPAKSFSLSPTLDRVQTSSSYSSSLSTSGVTNDGRLVELIPAPLHVAHVATDDKALLARLADLASCPPVDEGCPSGSTPVAQGSAPTWHDEDVEDIPPELVLVPGQSSHPMFPAPPSKEVLAASAFYHYPFAFDEMESLEAELQPSAPPFEEYATSSSLHDSRPLVPSAPPLLEDDQDHDFAPSAPEWDSNSSAPEPDADVHAGQDHDRLDDSQSAVSIPLPASSSSSSHTTPPLREPSPATARDSIALPVYKP